METRNIHFDVAKGFGIIMIVLGHNSLVENNRKIFEIIFSFHVPLFFFLSGLLFEPAEKLAILLMKKVDSILKPYFIVSIILGVFYIIFEKINGINYFAGILYGNGLTILWIPMWFLTHLFAINVFCWFFLYVLNSIKVSKFLIYPIIFIFFSIGVIFIKSFWLKKVSIFGCIYTLYGLPFSIDIILVSSFYFLLGYFIKDYISNFKPSLFVSFFVLNVFIFSHVFFDRTIDLNLRNYEGIFFPTIVALSGIYLILLLSYCFCLIKKLSQIIAFIGKSSLMILIFHFYIQSKSFIIIQSIIGNHDFILSICSFLLGTTIPVGIYWFVMKFRFARVIFYPLKSFK